MELMNWNFLCDLILPSLTRILEFWKFDPWTSYLGQKSEKLWNIDNQMILRDLFEKHELENLRQKVLFFKTLFNFDQIDKLVFSKRSRNIFWFLVGYKITFNTLFPSALFHSSKKIQALLCCARSNTNKNKDFYLPDWSSLSSENPSQTFQSRWWGIARQSQGVWRLSQSEKEGF